jgi:hypothetical protein
MAKIMATIDKTYFESLNQYLEFREYWLKTYDEQIRVFGEPTLTYPMIVVEDEQNQAIDFRYNFSDILEVVNWGCTGVLYISTAKFDRWMIKNQLQIPSFILDRLKEQYGENNMIWS